jgi:hypothetical protein
MFRIPLEPLLCQWHAVRFARNIAQRSAVEPEAMRAIILITQFIFLRVRGVSSNTVQFPGSLHYSSFHLINQYFQT